MGPAGGRVWQHLAYIAVILSIVPLAAPVLMPDALIGHDAGAHHTYAFLFARALGQGQFPVRWVEGIADGMGQPLFNYYQVGFYYVTALLDWIGVDLAIALKLTVVAGWAGGAVFMFLLCRPLGSLPAALGAAVFVWSPYLMLDVYVRNAYPELMAIGIVPGLLWSIDRVLRTGRPIFAGALAGFCALLLITHLPTALIATPLCAVFLIGSWIARRPPVRAIVLVGLGVSIGAGLAAFYVVPAIGQIDAVSVGKMTTGYFDYHRHFVRPEWWFDTSWGYAGSGEGSAEQMSMQLGMLQWIVVGTAVVVLAIPRLRRRLPLPSIMLAAWLAVVALALFMMTAYSAAIWETIGPMAYIQYPWRLLMLATIACAVLAAILLACVRHRTTRVVVVLCAVAFQWQQTAPYREMASSRERASLAIDDPRWPQTESARKAGFREPAYDPISVRRTPEPAGGRWSLDGTGEVSAISQTDANLDLSVIANGPVKLVINTPYFPGWQTRVDGRLAAAAVDPESGYMVVAVPAGTHRVSASFGRDRLRTVAELITLFSVFAWFGVAIAVRAQPMPRYPIRRR